MAKSLGTKTDPQSQNRDNHDSLEKSEQDLLIRLGAAALDLWDRLPRERQQSLFSKATAQPGSLDVARLRRQMALVLHAHHERTAQARPDAGHAGSDPPPAGPHARPGLTNPDATPGSGLFSTGKGHGAEVDPGGG